MRRLCIVFCLLGIVSIVSAEVDTSVETLDVNHCKIKSIFAHVYKGSPQVKREKAAWIVKNSIGQYELVDWPRTVQNWKQVWVDVLPPNIVALAHTHPDDINPKPSEKDKSVAQKMNIPIYTLTRKGIWSVSPNGTIAQHEGPGWFKNGQEQCKEVFVSNAANK